MQYTIEEHKHRFAAWAAGRGANVNGCRFSVLKGKNVLEAAIEADRGGLSTAFAPWLPPGRGEPEEYAGQTP